MIEERLLICLRGRANARGVVPVRANALASEVEASQDDVRAALENLARAGLVEILAPFPFLVVKLRKWSGEAVKTADSAPSAYSYPKQLFHSQHLKASYRPKGEEPASELLHEILETLGPGGWSAQRLSNPHEAGLWQSSLQYLIHETAQPGPGNRAVLARLSEFLFMELLRWQLRTSAESGSGWFAGLHDPHVGRALQLMHSEPARAWSVQDLARQSALSRASLGRKFVALVGHSPMQYLAVWRMHLARQLLRDSRLGIGEIAGRVGYESEAAFNRAFRRLVGSPPSAWRQARVPLAHAAGREIHLNVG